MEIKGMISNPSPSLISVPYLPSKEETPNPFEGYKPNNAGFTTKDSSDRRLSSIGKLSPLNGSVAKNMDSSVSLKSPDDYKNKDTYTYPNKKLTFSVRCPVDDIYKKFTEIDVNSADLRKNKKSGITVENKPGFFRSLIKRILAFFCFKKSDASFEKSNLELAISNIDKAILEAKHPFDDEEFKPLEKKKITAQDLNNHIEYIDNYIVTILNKIDYNKKYYKVFQESIIKIFECADKSIEEANGEFKILNSRLKKTHSNNLNSIYEEHITEYENILKEKKAELNKECKKTIDKILSIYEHLGTGYAHYFAKILAKHCADTNTLCNNFIRIKDSDFINEPIYWMVSFERSKYLTNVLCDIFHKFIDFPSVLNSPASGSPVNPTQQDIVKLKFPQAMARTENEINSLLGNIYKLGKGVPLHA